MEFMSSTMIFMMLLGTGRSSDPLTLPGGTGNFSELFQNSCARSGCKNYTDSTVRSCSQKCSCQPNCHEVGTCCPDMPGIDDLKPKYECKDLSEFYYKHPDHITSVTGVYFRVVDDCPNGSMSKEYPRCLNATYLDDFIIVSDLLDERLYRNHHCARCHGVSEYVSWRAEVHSCDEIMYERFSSFEERDQYILANCDVISAPPKAESGEMSRCFSGYSSEHYCQHSTQNSTIINTIKTLCNASRPTTSMMFFADRVLRIGERLYTYPNIFCYFCELGAVPVSVSCALKTNPIAVKNPSLIKLTALLTGHDELTVNQGDDNCPLSTIWDPYSTNCRPIFCQLGTIPAGKRCLPVFQDVHGVAVSLYVIFSVPLGYLSHTQNIFHLVDSILQGLISQNGASCGLCERFFRNINGSGSEMLMEFSVFTTSMCTVSHILKMARYLLSQGTIGFQMQLNNDTFDIWFKLSTQEIDRDYQIDGILEGYQCKSRKQIVDWMFLDCPHFRLRSDSLETLGLGNTVQKTLLHKMVMTKIYNSSDIAICINDYFSARLLNSAKKNYIANGLSLLTFLLAYLL